MVPPRIWMVLKKKRLPKELGDIRPEHLPAFAEWQKRLDRELEGRATANG